MMYLITIALGVTMFFLHFFKIVGGARKTDFVAMYIWGLVAVMSGAIYLGQAFAPS